MPSMRCNDLLCIGRLVSKADKVMYTMHIFLFVRNVDANTKDRTSLAQLEAEIIALFIFWPVTMETIERNNKTVVTHRKW